MDVPTSEATLGNRMKELGYTPGMIGKWHLGNAPELLPTAGGFDEVFHPVGNAVYFGAKVLDSKVSRTKFTPQKDISVIEDQDVVKKILQRRTSPSRRGQALQMRTSPQSRVLCGPVCVRRTGRPHACLCMTAPACVQRTGRLRQVPGGPPAKFDLDTQGQNPLYSVPVTPSSYHPNLDSVVFTAS